MSPRLASSAPATLVQVDSGTAAPAYRQICDSLREAIVGGRLAPGSHIPGTRVLASDLGVSRNTVNGALAQLRAEGYVVARARTGTFVNERLPDLPVPAARTGTAAPPRSARERARARSTPRPVPVSARSALLSGLPIAAGRSLVEPARPFQTGVPALDAFPWGLWARLFGSRARRAGAALSGYGSVHGYRPLREAIAAYVAAARGARCTAPQIVVTAGAQQGLDLVARVLIDPGDAVWLEDPGYPAARGVFAAAGARVVPVGLDAEGLQPAAAGTTAPRLVYVTPSRQYPTGITMSAARRLELLRRAAGGGVWIVEDDYDSEFRYASRPLPCLQGLDDAGRVIYVGTFSKTVFPGLRLGYLIVPEELVDAFGEARALCDRQPPGIEQAVLTDFLALGHFARHVRRMRALYEERRDALLTASRELLGERILFGDTAAGMLALAWLPPGVDDQATSRRLLAEGVEAPPLSSYAIRPLRRGGLLLGYAGYPPQALRAGVRRLAAALHAGGRQAAP
ncbi:MAG TPA: PLP-dependent aminotransferase family protein [Gemmatimonadales bacterium]|nr:PLP-dependent aminotransferase family protein [Gemmatimonadales bacterium]